MRAMPPQNCVVSRPRIDQCRPAIGHIELDGHLSGQGKRRRPLGPLYSKTAHWVGLQTCSGKPKREPTVFRAQDTSSSKTRDIMSNSWPHCCIRPQWLPRRPSLVHHARAKVEEVLGQSQLRDYTADDILSRSPDVPGPPRCVVYGHSKSR